VGRILLLALGLVALVATAAAAREARLADLWLTGSDRPDPAAVGKPLTYTVVLRNKGPNAAKGVRLSGQVGRVGTSSRRALVMLKLKGKGCRKLAGGNSPVIALSCAVRTMAAHSRVVITVVVRPTARGTFRLAAFVSSATPYHPATEGRRRLELRTMVRRR
jgi:uncharacterized protein DUF11